MSFALTTQEAQAFRIVKAVLRKDPKKVELLFDGAPEEMAYCTLKRISKDLNEMLAVNQAFASASAILVEKFKEKSCQEPTPSPQMTITNTTNTAKTT